MHWSLPYSLLVYAALAIAVAAVIWAARRLAISPRLKSWLLFVPRVIVFGVLLVILLGPIHRHQTQLPPKTASVAYLVDCSRSMALDAPSSRLDQAKQAIVEAEGRISPDNRPRVQVFRFGEGLSASPTAAQLEPTDDATRLQRALETLPTRFEKDAPKAVVVFSDGTTDETAELAELAAGYREYGAPIHVYPLGDRNVQGEVAVYELSVPRQAEPGAKVPIRAVLRSRGFNGQRVVVQVRRASQITEQPLASLPITLTGDVQPCDLVVEAAPDLGELTLEVPPLEGDAIAENNRVPFRLSHRDRKIRVFYMEGTLNNEYRWIRDALHEDPDIQCTVAQVNQQYLERPQLQRIDDPYRGYPATREELLQYDVVICSDISQGAFTREQIDWTVELVGERGGGFAMVGGHTSFGSGGWDQTAWEKLIPFDMTGRRDYWNATFQVRVPPQAQSHPIWRILDDPERNRQALAQMPPFFGTNLISRLKPAATLLGESDQNLTGAGPMPIFGAEAFGRGRTFAMATDSTEYWGHQFERLWGEGDNRYFRKFWRNVVRWLAENSIGGGRRLHVETDKIIYRPGEPIRIAARTFDETLAATTAYAVTARLLREEGGASGASFPLPPIHAEQLYRGELEAQLPAASAEAPADTSFLQTAKLEVAAVHEGQQVARTLVEIQLLNDSEELLDPRPAPEVLHNLAKASGGRVLQTPADLADAISGFPATPGEVLVHQTPLWDRSYLWAFLVMLLAVEWTLRRRSGFG